MHIYTKTIYGMWIKQESYNLFSSCYQYSDTNRTAFAISSTRKRKNVIKTTFSQEVLIKTQNLQFLLGEKT